MKSLVVDTNIISFIVKSDTRAGLYLPYLKGSKSIISFMTLAELHRWARERNWSEKRLNSMLSYLELRYWVQHSEVELCEKWADIFCYSRGIGKPIGHADAWIASTALFLGIPLITHNPKDFSHLPEIRLITA